MLTKFKPNLYSNVLANTKPDHRYRKITDPTKLAFLERYGYLVLTSNSGILN